MDYIKEQIDSVNDNLKLTCQTIGFFSSQLSTLNDPSNFYSDMISNLRATTDSAEQSLVKLVQESGSYEFGGHSQQAYILIGLLNRTCGLQFLDLAFNTNFNSRSTNIDFSFRHQSFNKDPDFGDISFDDLQIDQIDLQNESSLDLSDHGDIFDLRRAMLSNSTHILDSSFIGSL